MRYRYSDIYLTADGDLTISPTGDLYVASGVSALRQGIETRLKTELGDLFMHPGFGNNLKEMIGKRNTRKVAEEGKRAIINCLTYGGFIDPGDLSVAAIPTDENTILYHVEVFTENYVVYKFDLICDLENGIRRA